MCLTTSVLSSAANNKRNEFLKIYLVIGVLLCSFYGLKAQSSQTLTNGGSTTPVTFDAACTYSWTNSNPAIGLAASGTGNIASFKAINNTNSPVTATVTATPTVAGFAYIACYGTAGNGYVDKIDIATDLITGTIPITEYPQAIAVSKNGDILYTTNQNSGTIVKVLTGSNTVSPYSATGYGIAIAPNDNVYYYTSSSTGTLVVVNTITNNTTAINVGNNPYGVVVSNNGSRVYVANYGSNSVSVIDATNNTVIATIPIGLNFSPYGIAISPKDDFVYVTNYGNNSVSVISTAAINTATNPVIKNVAVGTQPVGVTVNPDGSSVYVTNKGSNTVSIINTATNTVTNTITVGTAPFGISITPDGKKVYVANSGSSSVSVITTATDTISRNILTYPTPESFGNFIAKGSCPVVTFTITVNPTPITATITTNGSISSLNTVYGTPSTAAAFTVSGTNLTAGILVTPPTGFEVSTDDITFGNKVTIPPGTGGSVSSVTVFIRLKSTAGAGTSYSGNVVLSSAGAIDATIATAGSSVAKAQLNITANNINKTYGTALSVTAGSTNFTSSGLKNGETIGSVTLTYGNGGQATAALAIYLGAITPSAPTGGTFLLANYTLNPFTGTLTVNKAPLIITADNKARAFGFPNPALTVTYTGFVNNEDTTKLITPAVATTTATISSLPGQYVIISIGASATNYAITYVQGIFTINPVVQPITVPNAFTPNNDGINDTWEIKYLASSYPNCTVEVFNRYSERVYFSKGYATAWNGRYNGVDLPFGTYYYIINTHSNTKPFTGYLTILR
jgi:gliding motility-associated-like protein